MEHYQTYLRAELGKLRDLGDASAFAVSAGGRLEAFRLQGDALWLTRAFASQDLVDSYVAGLDSHRLVGLTECCSAWRHNNVAARLSRVKRAESVFVAVESILLSPAESYLRCLFERGKWRLDTIARDPELHEAPAYRDQVGKSVPFGRCLAEPAAPGLFRIFDGMHRAIQLFRNAETTIPLCLVHDR